MTGITNEADEARDAPNYVPRVFSSATHYGSIYTDSRSVSPEEEEQDPTLCFQFARKKAPGKRRRSPIVIVPHRNVLEKVASHQREGREGVDALHAPSQPGDCQEQVASRASFQLSLHPSSPSPAVSQSCKCCNQSIKYPGLTVPCVDPRPGWKRGGVNQ